MITLISKENYLLDKMIHSLEEKFVYQGGYSEQLRQKREKERRRQIWWRSKSSPRGLTSVIYDIGSDTDGREATSTCP